MKKVITLVAKGNLIKERMMEEAIKICNNEAAVDEVMRAKTMKSLIQGVIKENMRTKSQEIIGLEKALVRFQEDGYSYNVILVGSPDMVLYFDDQEKEAVEELFTVSVKTIPNEHESVYLGYEEIIVA